MFAYKIIQIKNSISSLILFAGEMVKSERGHVRSFGMNKVDLKTVTLRSNQRHDTLVDLKQYHEQQMITFSKRSKKEREVIQKQHKNAERGILGRCILRSLSIFDVGTSFMADSLHNVYSGAFVSRNILENHVFCFD